MIKALTFVALTLTTPLCWSQVTVTGTVMIKGEKEPAPGINIVEKGTTNGTTTQSDGTFELTVSDPNATLMFSFVGLRNQEYQLNGETEILVKMEVDCIVDFFDSHQIYIYANSGVLNNPVGGQIDVSSPGILGGVIKGSYGYQTDLDVNTMQTAGVALAHYVANCDFNMDFRWGYRKVAFENNLDFRINSFEADLNINNMDFTAGYTHLDFTKAEPAQDTHLSGAVIGVTRYFYVYIYKEPHPITFAPTATAKVGLYHGKVEYQAAVEAGYRRVLCFVKFYKLDSFHELSVGLGIGFGYSRKWPRE